jgi:hypothetical protein
LHSFIAQTTEVHIRYNDGTVEWGYISEAQGKTGNFEVIADGEEPLLPRNPTLEYPTRKFEWADKKQSGSGAVASASTKKAEHQVKEKEAPKAKRARKADEAVAVNEEAPGEASAKKPGRPKKAAAPTVAAPKAAEAPAVSTEPSQQGNADKAAEDAAPAPPAKRANNGGAKRPVDTNPKQYDGRKVKVHWELEGSWYKGTVVENPPGSVRRNSKKYAQTFLLYVSQYRRNITDCELVCIHLLLRRLRFTFATTTAR